MRSLADRALFNSSSDGRVPKPSSALGDRTATGGPDRGKLVVDIVAGFGDSELVEGGIEPVVEGGEVGLGVSRVITTKALIYASKHTQGETHPLDTVSAGLGERLGSAKSTARVPSTGRCSSCCLLGSPSSLLPS